MKIHAKSFFKDTDKDFNWLRKWVEKLEIQNSRKYHSITVETSLGKTQIWSLNSYDVNLETLVIFPGARTTTLFWDFDKGLDHFGHPLNIYLVETNGLPNFSNGATPDIKSLDYGIWAAEVFDKLKIEKAYVAGSSFGGLICMKLGIVKPNHQLSAQAEELLVDYEVFAISRYKDNTQKPYYMNGQLDNVKVATYLLEGDKDLLFPFQKSIDNAKKHLTNLKEVKVFENVGHGIETYNKALKYIGNTINKQLT